MGVRRGGGGGEQALKGSLGRSVPPRPSNSDAIEGQQASGPKTRFF